MGKDDFIYLARFDDGVETIVLEDSARLVDYLVRGWGVITREMFMDIWKARDAAALKRLRTDALRYHIRKLQKKANSDARC